MGPELKSIIDSLTSSVYRLTQLLDGFEGEFLYHSPAPDEWSIAQIVWHLGDVESRYRQRLERIVAEDTPQVPAVWPSPAPEPLPQVVNALAVFEQERGKTIAKLTRLTPDAWQRGVQHATLGSSTLKKQVQGLIDHDGEHLKQILRMMGRVEAGRLSD